MTADELKIWFQGFAEAIDGVPSHEQWATIKANMAESDGWEESAGMDRCISRNRPPQARSHGPKWPAIAEASENPAGHIGTTARGVVDGSGKAMADDKPGQVIGLDPLDVDVEAWLTERMIKRVQERDLARLAHDLGPLPHGSDPAEPPSNPPNMATGGKRIG